MALTRNPFRVSVKDLSSKHNEEEGQGIQEEFLDMIHDSTAKNYFEDESLEKFWGKMEKAYPKNSKKSLTLLTVFPSTYLCGSAFSSCIAIKTKARNRLLDLVSNLRCAFSKITPCISSLVDKKQERISH